MSSLKSVCNTNCFKVSDLVEVAAPFEGVSRFLYIPAFAIVCPVCLSLRVSSCISLNPNKSYNCCPSANFSTLSTDPHAFAKEYTPKASNP